MSMKLCKKCGENKPIESFSKNKNNKDGHEYHCKECKKKRTREYYENGGKEVAYKYRELHKLENLERKRERALNYYYEHKEKSLETKKEYYKKNREQIIKKTVEKYREKCINATEEQKEEIRKMRKVNSKKYYEKHKNAISEKSRKYYEENREKVLARTKEYRKSHYDKEKCAERYKEYYWKNKEKMNERVAKWTKENRAHVSKRTKITNQKRRAQKKNLSASLSNEQWDYIQKHFDNKCCYCGKELPLAQDHFIALSYGGEYTRNNIVPACRSCNSSKGNKNFFEWYPKHRYYSKKRDKKILEFLGYNDKGQQQLKLG